MQSFTTREDSEAGAASFRDAGGGALIRPMAHMDLDPIRELRSVVRWSADPRAFDLLRGMRHTRWTVAEAQNGDLAGMVGAVPLGEIGILCHLAVHEGYRGMGLGAELTSWAVAYLRSRGAVTVRLYSTRQAEKLYRSRGFEAVTPRTIYRLESAPRGLRSDRRARNDCQIETLTMQDLPEVYGVDRWSYGADRSALILATLRLHPGRGLVARDSSGRVKGYLVLSATPRTTHVGPFVASTSHVARLLLAGALEKAAAPLEVTATGGPESPVHSLLREFGFTGREDRLRMELRAASASPATGLEHYGTTAYLAT